MPLPCNNGAIVTTPTFLRRGIVAWLLLSLAGIVLLGRYEYQSQRDHFLQGASIAHRMLSQKAVQHEAVLETLGALSHPPTPERLLPSLRPALAELLGLGWPSPQGWQGSQPAPAGLEHAVERARTSGHAVVLPLDASHYWLVAPSSWSMLIDAKRLLAPADIADDVGTLTLNVSSNALALREQPASSGPLLSVAKILGSVSQPFPMLASRRVAPADWPWLAWVGWMLVSALLVGAGRYWQNSRRQARRQTEQARLAALSRLNTLGEMAAGIAHELNQPLTAILAQTRAAQRLMDDPDEASTVRQALEASAQQARRAADIIERLRALVGSGAAAVRKPLVPDSLAGNLGFLCEPELARHQISLEWTNTAPARAPWATQSPWNKSCTTWCKTPSPYFRPDRHRAASACAATCVTDTTNSASATTGPASPRPTSLTSSNPSTPRVPTEWGWAWPCVKPSPAPWMLASQRPTCLTVAPALLSACLWSPRHECLSHPLGLPRRRRRRRA